MSEGDFVAFLDFGVTKIKTLLLPISFKVMKEISMLTAVWVTTACWAAWVTTTCWAALVTTTFWAVWVMTAFLVSPETTAL